ncbi:MAG TPA: hypothetical protein VFY71_08385 [Planctomycetota bacterium]|nr:hypothetical protein [Planctomycetota bacterium]
MKLVLLAAAPGLLALAACSRTPTERLAQAAEALRCDRLDEATALLVDLQEDPDAHVDHCAWLVLRLRLLAKRGPSPELTQTLQKLASQCPSEATATLVGRLGSDMLDAGGWHGDIEPLLAVTVSNDPQGSAHARALLLEHAYDVEHQRGMGAPDAAWAEREIWKWGIPCDYGMRAASGMREIVDARSGGPTPSPGVQP